MVRSSSPDISRAIYARTLRELLATFNMHRRALKPKYSPATISYKLQEQYLISETEEEKAFAADKEIRNFREALVNVKSPGISVYSKLPSSPNPTDFLFASQLPQPDYIYIAYFGTSIDN